MQGYCRLHLISVPLSYANRNKRIVVCYLPGVPFLVQHLWKVLLLANSHHCQSWNFDTPAGLQAIFVRSLTCWIPQKQVNYPASLCTLFKCYKLDKLSLEVFVIFIFLSIVLLMINITLSMHGTCNIFLSLCLTKW